MIYPTYEDTSYKYIENEKLNFFNETQGQLFAKQFLVDSPYRGILLYHGLGTGKTCAALITSENIILKNMYYYLFLHHYDKIGLMNYHFVVIQYIKQKNIFLRIILL